MPNTGKQLAVKSRKKTRVLQGIAKAKSKTAFLQKTFYSLIL